MLPIEFKEQTTIIGKGQPPYLPIPGHKFIEDENGRVAFCWKATWKERLIILLTGKIWHQVLTFNSPLQPQKIDAVKPPHMNSTK